jgi:hypothetical protein
MLILNTGFEGGALSTNGGGLCAVITGSPSIDNTAKRSGSYSLLIIPSAAAEAVAYDFSTTQYVVIRGYLRLHTAPSAQIGIVQVRTSNNEYFKLKINTDRTLRAQVQYGTNVDGPVISTDIWYRFELLCYCGATTGTIDWKIAEGDGEATAYTQATGSITASTFYSLYLGDPYTASTHEVNIDDFALSATSGDYPLGAGKGIGISPNADGTHVPAPAEKIYDNGDVLVDASTNPAYVELDSVPISDNTDYIKQTTIDADDYVEVTFADISDAASVNGARAILAYMAAGTAAANGKTYLIDEDATATAIYSGDMSESSMFYKSVQAPNPTGGWDQAAVNALKVRLGYSSVVADVPYWENLMIEVDYVEAAGGMTLEVDPGSYVTAGAAADLIPSVTDYLRLIWTK